MRPALPLLISSLLLCSPLAAQQPAQQPAAKPPKLTMKRWMTTTVNGSADADGKNALVVRSRNIVLLSNLAAGKKPVERIIARPQEGMSMGYGWISPDARHGAIMDDMRALVIMNIDGGKTRTLTGRYMASDAMFTPKGDAVFWWRTELPYDRGEYPLRPENAEILKPCVIYRMDLTADAKPVQTTLPGCRNILHVSPDGAYAVVGEGGAERALKLYGPAQQDGEHHALDFKADSYARFHRVELATGSATLLAERELLAVSISDDGRVLCGSEPKAFQADGPARFVCVRDGQARELYVPAAEDPRRGWRSISVSPDGGKLAIALEAGPQAKQRGLTYVLSLDGAQDKPLLSERMHASTLAWLPGGRRLFATPDDAPARLYDLEAGWSVVVGEPGQEVSGIITLGQRDDRFLVGVERKSTRDMWMVELSR